MCRMEEERFLLIIFFTLQKDKSEAVSPFIFLKGFFFIFTA